MKISGENIDFILSLFDEKQISLLKMLQDNSPPCLKSEIFSSPENILKCISFFAEISHPDFKKQKDDFKKLYETLCRHLKFENPPEFKIEEFHCPLTCSLSEIRKCNSLLSWLQRILISSPKVREIVKSDESIKYELIFPNGKTMIIDPLSPSLSTDIALSLLKIFRYPVIIDFRRKVDRERLTQLFNYLGTHVSEEISEDSASEDSETLLLQENVLSILYSRELIDELSLDEGTAFFDGTFAYYSRDALLSSLSSVGIQVSPTQLSRFLKGLGIEVVRRRVEGVKRTFYKFKPTKRQIEKFQEERKDGD